MLDEVEDILRLVSQRDEAQHKLDRVTKEAKRHAKDVERLDSEIALLIEALPDAAVRAKARKKVGFPKKDK